MDVTFDHNKIVKIILFAGSETVSFHPETKVTFHFQTRLCDDNKTLLDDSREWNKPMQLILGRKFKLAVWEVLVKNMALNEVAQFVVDKSLVDQYPYVARVYRDSAKNKPVHSQCCFGSIAKGMADYKDLEKLLQNPQNLEFIFELIDVQHSGQYEKEYWQITDDNKQGLIPQLKEEGNKYYCVKDYEKAIEKYNLALNFIDHLQLREKPHDDEWNALNTMKLPLYLNLAQCKLCLKEYYAAIDYANQVLQHDSNNIKALFRRGKAHLQVWNLTEAEDDLKRVLLLNSSLKSSVLPLLSSLKKAKLESQQTEKLFATKGVL